MSGITFYDDSNDPEVSAGDRIYRTPEMESQVMAYISVTHEPILNPDGSFNEWFGHWVLDRPEWPSVFKETVDHFISIGFFIQLGPKRWKRVKMIDYGTLIEELKVKYKI